MGKAGTRFGRNTPTEATEPEPMPQRMEPSPREVANRLLLRDEFKPATSLNVLAACWIQFQNHDWFGHGENAPDTYIDVELDENDNWPEGSTMKVRATIADRTRTGTRAACRRPSSTPSPTGGTSRRSTDRTRSATASCAPARDGKLQDRGRHAAERDRGQARRRRPHRLLRQLLDRPLAAPHAVRQGAQRDLRPPQGLLSHLGRREALPHGAPHQLGASSAQIHTVEWTPGILANPVLDRAMHANWYGSCPSGCASASATWARR